MQLEVSFYIIMYVCTIYIDGRWDTIVTSYITECVYNPRHRICKVCLINARICKVCIIFGRICKLCTFHDRTWKLCMIHDKEYKKRLRSTTQNLVFCCYYFRSGMGRRVRFCHQLTRLGSRL